MNDRLDLKEGANVREAKNRYLQTKHLRKNDLEKVGNRQVNHIYQRWVWVVARKKWITEGERRDSSA